MLILHLFGTNEALEHWALKQVIVTPRATARTLSVARGEAHITFAQGVRIVGGGIVEILGVVVRDPFDLSKLQGLEPSLVVQDDSFLALGRVDLLEQIYPRVR